MTIATGSRHDLNRVSESSYGVTPSTPGFISFPCTGFNGGMSKDGLESAKIRQDRQVEDFRHGNKQVGFEIPAELEYSSFDEALEAVLCGTWSGDVLKAGTTRRSSTFERRFADLNTPEWHRYLGAELNTFSLSVSPNQIATCSFGVIAQDLAIATSAIAGATYAADDGNEPFDSFTGSITEGGSTTGNVTALELNINNGLERAFAIGSQLTLRPTIGRSRVTGSLTAYYESKSLYEKFLNETSSELVLTLSDPAGNDLQIDIPNVVYTSGNPDFQGDGSIMVSMEFTALYSSSDASQIVLTRTDA